MRFYFVSYFFIANTRLLSKLLLIFDLNGLFLHAIHKISLLENKWSREPDITTLSKIYFICPRFKEFLNNCLSHFEVGYWTSVQWKNVIELYPYLLSKNGFKREKFKFIWAQEDCTTMIRKDHPRNGNQNIYLKHLKSI